jgi:Tol biopolymer transport system component
MDPTRSGDQSDLVRLSSTPGLPTAWSPDGSQLLVQRATNGGELFVLGSNGNERLLTHADWTQSGAGFTPDGTRVVYAAGPRDDQGGIYSINAEGGTPKLLLAADAMLYEPALSPDGSQIAYFDGWGDSGHSLRVMDSDGTGMRVVLENDMTMGVGHVNGLDWSPDGRHLVFALSSHGVYVVSIDGSGLTQVSSETFEGVNPHWSPDGSLISYNTGAFDALVISRSEGTRVREFDYGRSGPWNPR